MADKLHRMQETHGKHMFGFWPQTFTLPKEYDKLVTEMEKAPTQFWIAKPAAASQGKGIIITNRLKDIPKTTNQVVSHYIANPLTIDGLKFDLRVYVAITSIEPLRIYMYKEGLVRFATELYNPPHCNHQNPFVHLTNYSINKQNKGGVFAEHEMQGEAEGTKWSFKAFRDLLRQHKINDEKLFARIKQIVVKTIIACESTLHKAQTIFAGANNCFQLLGFDILVDDQVSPWLLEVNLSPSMTCSSVMDRRIKANLIADLLNLAGIPAGIAASGAAKIRDSSADSCC